jgi:hypothetical protein
MKRQCPKRQLDARRTHARVQNSRLPWVQDHDARGKTAALEMDHRNEKQRTSNKGSSDRFSITLTGVTTTDNHCKTRRTAAPFRLHPAYAARAQLQQSR